MEKKICSLQSGFLMQNLLHTIHCNDINKVKDILKDNIELTDAAVAKKLGFTSPLWKALFCEHLDIVELLVEFGANPDERYPPYKYTPLQWLSAEKNFTPGNIKLANYLISHGAEVKVSDKSNEYKSALWYAIKRCSIEWTEFFLKNGAEMILFTDDNTVKVFSPVLATAYHICSKTNKILHLLKNYGMNFASVGALRNDYSSNLIHMFMCYLRRGLSSYVNVADVIDYVDFLCNAGVSFNEPVTRSDGGDSCSTLSYAILTRIPELVQYFIDKGLDVNERSKIQSTTPLFFAILRFNENIINKLLAAGADINVSNKSKKTPMHLVCYSHHHGSIEFLIKKGAKISIIDNDGKTPFTYLLMDKVSCKTRPLKQCARFLIKEMAKQSFYNISTLHQVDLDIIKTNSQIGEQFEICVKEITIMIENKVCGIFSFFDIVVGSINHKKLAAYLRNEVIEEEYSKFLNSSTISYYKDELKNTYEKAIIFRDETMEVERKLDSILNPNKSEYINVPDVVLWNIAKFLTPRDLL